MKAHRFVNQDSFRGIDTGYHREIFITLLAHFFMRMFKAMLSNIFAWLIVIMSNTDEVSLCTFLGKSKINGKNTNDKEI